MFIGLCQKSWTKSWQLCRKKKRDSYLKKKLTGEGIKDVKPSPLCMGVLWLMLQKVHSTSKIFSLTSFLDLAQRSLYWHAVIDVVHDNSKIPFTFFSLSAWVMTVIALSLLLFPPWIAPFSCQVALHLICQKKIFSLALTPRKRNHLRLVQWFPERTRVFIGWVLFPCLLLLLVIFFWLLLIPFLLSVLHVMVVDLIKILK